MKSVSAVAFDFNCLLLVSGAYYPCACDTLRKRERHTRVTLHTPLDSGSGG